MPHYGPSISGYLKAVAREVEPWAIKPRPKKPNPVPTEEPPMVAAAPVASKLPDTIQTAALKKVDTEMKPVAEKMARLKTHLDTYETVARQEAERRVLNSVLTALGQEPMPDVEGAETSRTALRTALLEVCELVGGVLPLVGPSSVVDVHVVDTSLSLKTTAPAAEEKPETFAHLLAKSEVKPSAKRKLLSTDVEKAKRLVAEIEALSGKVQDNHPTRLYPLLQALVAEGRGLQDRLPEDHFLYERIGQLMPVLGGMKAESGISDYIKGLAFGSYGEWEKIASEGRRKVAQFDRDTAFVASQGPVKATPKPKVEAEKTSILHSWPKLPSLRAAMQKKPLFIVGGLVVNEKIELCANRFGVKVEWHETDSDSMKSVESMAHRIRTGGVCAIILLEGLIGHKTSNKITDACKTNHVPYVFGDKGGVASIETALNAIEQKLAS
jgi:hypothetical protein